MLAWREWLAEDTGWQPARAGPVPVAWLGLTAAWPGTGGRRPLAYRAHRGDHPAWEPGYGGGHGRACFPALAGVALIARAEGGAGGAGTAAVHDTGDPP